MPHKCVKCGREFEDGSSIILRGCPSCGGKKFFFVREQERHKDVLEEKKPEELALKQSENEMLEVKEAPPYGVQVYDRIESIRIVGPGSYELNIEKLADSDERIVRLDDEGKYAIDIQSMTKEKKHKKKK